MEFVLFELGYVPSKRARLGRSKRKRERASDTCQRCALFSILDRTNESVWNPFVSILIFGLRTSFALCFEILSFEGIVARIRRGKIEAYDARSAREIELWKKEGCVGFHRHLRGLSTGGRDEEHGTSECEETFVHSVHAMEFRRLQTRITSY